MSNNAVADKAHLFNVICNHICEVLPDLDRAEITEDRTLEELGANSMDRADILMDIMDTLSLDIPRVEMFGPKTIAELIALLSEKLS